MFLIRGFRTTFTWDTSRPTSTTAKSSCSFSHLGVESFEQQSVFPHFSLVRVGLHVLSAFISMERTLLE